MKWNPFKKKKDILVLDINTLVNYKKLEAEDLKKHLEKDLDVKIILVDNSRENLRGMLPANNIKL